MTINVNPNESPNEGRDGNEVSSSEVPVYQLMDGINSDNDFDINDNTSDDSDGDNYELLSQDYNESNQQMTYYEHNVVVNWVESQDGEPNETISGSDETNNETNNDVIQVSDSINTNTTDCDPNEATISESNHLSERRFSLNDGKYQINQIKGLMSGFELPNDNIPVWAQNIPEDEWKSLLLTKLEEKKTTKESNE